MIQIRVLGGFAVHLDGKPVPPGAFKGRLVQRLVRVLVSHRGEFVSRDVLTEALWPGGPPADPERNLNVLVNRARRALGDSRIIATSPGGYSIDTGGCAIDSEAFLASARRGCDQLAARQAGAALGQFRDALDRWAGEPLPEDAYEDWAQPYRDELNRSHLEALEKGAVAALETGDAALCAHLAKNAVAQAPLKEGCNLLLVHALAESGNTAGALEAMAQFRRRLADDLGLDPSAEANELETRILRGEISAPARAPTAYPVPPVGGLPFVGRDLELQTLVSLAAAAVPRIALLEGDSGLGKSRLLFETASRAPVPTLSARAHLPERDLPWGLARALLRLALALCPEAAQAIGPRATEILAGMLPELELPRSIESEPLLAAPLDPQSVRAFTLEGAISLLQAASPEGILIIADDLQWADASSLALLELAIRRMDGARFIVAYRPKEAALDPAVSTFVSRLRAGEHAPAQLVLGPLAPGAVAALAADADLGDALVQQTNCTPFEVVEVIRSLSSRPESGHDPGDTTGRVRRAVHSGRHRAIELRMAGEPAECIELLHLLAILAREAPARLLALAADAEQSRVEKDLVRLTATGLIRLGDGGWAIEHDLIGEVIAGHLDRSQSGRLHHTFARVLIADGAEPSEIARHLALAGDVGAAADAFSQAARRSLDGFAHPEAERLAGAGLALIPASSVRPATWVALHDIRAEARARLGRIPQAQQDLRAALALTQDGPGRSRLLARMAMVVSGAQNLAHAAELAELAVVEAGRDNNSRAEALAVGAIMDMNSGRQHRAQTRFDEALALFEQHGNARGAAAILDGRAMSKFLAGNIAEAVEMFDRVARLFLDAGELLRICTPRSTHGHGQVFMAQPEAGLRQIDAALELARSLGHAEGEAYGLWHRSEALAALGRTAESVAAAQESLALARHLGHREWTAGALRGLGIAWEAAGNLEQAETTFRQSLHEAEHLPLFASWAAARLAAVLVAQGDRKQSPPLIEFALQQGLPLSLYEVRLAQVELAAARGDDDTQILATDALSLARAGGHLASAARLSQLAGTA